MYYRSSQIQVKKLRNYLLLILLLLPTCAFSIQNPLWPLDIEISQSSSFAEFRGFRFHAGIDLRTQRRNGLPVRAIEDGFVSRMKVQFRGYGYALYIDHPKLQKRVVYGHLQDFSGDMKVYADAKLQKIGQRFGIDDFFGPDRFPVKKGQIVALSGETGSGPPHLHFEVRNFADDPEAPALIGYRPADKIFPEFHHFYIEPFSFPCEINRSFLPYKGSLHKLKGRPATLHDKPEICGKVGFKIGVSDNNGLGNVFGVEKLILSSGDYVLFARNFHRYTYAQNQQCYLVYDYLRSNQKGTGYVVNLFKLPGETLSFAEKFEPWSGLFNSDDYAGILPITVDATDFGNNQVKFTSEISFGQFDYSKIFAADLINNYDFDKTVATAHYIVAIGQKNNPGNRVFRRGSIVCHDGDDKSEALPCILFGRTAEIAIPINSRWQKGLWVNKRRIFPAHSYVADQGTKILAEEGGMVEFPKGSLDFPILSRFFRANLNPAPGGNEKRGRLKPFSPVWRLEPDDVVFATEAKIFISPLDYSGDMQKLGIYKVNGNGDYSHVGEKLIKTQLMATTRLGGEWVILEDSVAPEITYSAKSQDYHLGKVWVFKVKDLGEGIDYLSAIATADGKKVEVYSDPDKAEIYVVRDVQKKKVNVELSVKDFAGNTGNFSKKL